MKTKFILTIFSTLGFTLLQAQGQQPYLCLSTPPGVVLTPSWQYEPGIIFVKCPDEVAVGIGTVTPRSRLDVIGTTQTSKLAIGLDPTTMEGRFHLKASGLSSNNTSTLFLVENTQRKLMQLNNQGLLQVREVKVDLLAWPDYVFKPTYKLMPLEEVEAFIRTEGHLPHVPTAGEIEENGLEVGRMNKILMEKVEELTLYLIEQQKLLQEQQHRIDELEANIQKGQ